MWGSTRHWSTVCASPRNLGFSGFTSAKTLSLLSIKSWEGQTITTPAWLHTGGILGSCRINSMALSSTTSSGEITRQPMPSPGSSRATNRLLQACSSLPSDSRRTSCRPRPSSPLMNTIHYRHWGSHRVRTTGLRLTKSTWGPQPRELNQTRSLRER
jgi:hypothetical protein